MSDESKDNNDIEIEFEETDPTPKKLREKLKKCTEEKQEYLQGWQRAKADLINARKDFEEEKKAIRKFASEGLIVELSSVLQSFDSAFANKEAWEKVDENWRRGVEYIYTQFTSILEGNGLSIEDPLGATFDPEKHESVEVIATDDAKQDGVIAAVIQKGLMLNGKVIKPARVKVFHTE